VAFQQSYEDYLAIQNQMEADKLSRKNAVNYSDIPDELIN
jgi:hypothetical protein